MLNYICCVGVRHKVDTINQDLHYLLGYSGSASLAQELNNAIKLVKETIKDGPSKSCRN